jgi:endonuclease/exonuclease/phosphatase family metal-dependent hydrolase
VSRVLRAATWNVHGCVGRDGRRDPRRTAAVLDALAADVIALQEVDERMDAQLDLLARDAHVVHGPTLRTARGAYGNALLCARPPDEIERVDLTVAPREPRGAVRARLPGDPPLHVVATHLGLRGWERAQQVARLLELVERLSPPVLLLGDLNEWRGRGALTPLAARLAPLPAPRSFPARLPTLRLDRGFASRETLVSARAVVARFAEARAASDHLPVVYEVALAAGRPAAEPLSEADAPAGRAGARTARGFRAGTPLASRRAGEEPKGA